MSHMVANGNRGWRSCSRKPFGVLGLLSVLGITEVFLWVHWFPSSAKPNTLNYKFDPLVHAVNLISQDVVAGDVLIKIED